MIPIRQTRVGKGGNCFQACVASILEMPLEAVPDFCNEYPEDWFLKLGDWLKPMGMSAIMIKYDDGADLAEVLKDQFVLAGGTSAVRSIPHEVIWMNGKVIWDPAPERKGLKGRPDDFIVFTLSEPAVMTQLRQVQKIVDEQEKDEGIQFYPETAPEAYLQKEIHRLHIAINVMAAVATVNVRKDSEHGDEKRDPGRDRQTSADSSR